MTRRSTLQVLSAVLALTSAVGCAFAGGPADAPRGTHRAEQPAACPARGAAIQVLGSGGPVAEGDRAGTSYLLRIDGVPRLLVDAGAGSWLRFAEGGGRVASLDAIVITHLHADHAGDLAGILNTGGFEGRTRSLVLIGPDAAERFPSITAHAERLIGKDGGALAYLGGYLDGTEDKPKLDLRTVTTANGTAPAQRFDLGNGLVVTAIPVNHGPAPTFGVKIEAGGKTIIIAGDQSNQSAAFVRYLAGSRPDLLFAHHVIPEGGGQPRALHRSPAEIGEMAAAVNPVRLVLSHNMKRSLDRLDEGLAAIERSYHGPVSVAADLDCYAP